MNEETQESQTETAVEETTQTETEKTVETKVEDKSRELESALEQKRHFREKAEKAEAERKALEEKLNKLTNKSSSLDVEDYIDISASLEGLDQREKERLAREHKLTGRPLSEIRKDEDFILWQKAYQDKREKDKLMLKPSSTQTESEGPKSITDRLKNASMADKEKILIEAGLYKSPRPRSDRSHIGSEGLR